MVRNKPLPFWYGEVAEAKRSYPDLDSFLQPFLSIKQSSNAVDTLKALNEEILKEASWGVGKQLYPYQERKIIAIVRIFGDIALYEAVSEGKRSSIGGRAMVKLYELEVETLKVEKALSGLAFSPAFKDDAAKNMLLLENVRRQAIEPLLRRNGSAAVHKREELAKTESETPVKTANAAPLPEDKRMREEEPHEDKEGSVIRSRLEDWNAR